MELVCPKFDRVAQNSTHRLYAHSSQRRVFCVSAAEMMGKNKGTICKWAAKALKEGRISGSKNKLLPPSSIEYRTRQRGPDD